MLALYGGKIHKMALQKLRKQKDSKTAALEEGQV
jgi:hypothetical protein